MNCFSANEIMERAKEKIIPLESQKETIHNIASLLSLQLKKLSAMENGIEADFLPVFSELIIAPTGSGKTYLISKLAEAADLPFYSIDCSMLTMSGYKGLNLGEAFRTLKTNCHKPREFGHSIILFDEFDKCSFRSGESGNVQPNLLKLLEGEPLSCGDTIIDTSKMLFLFAGAFQGLDKLMEQRCKSGTSLGFVSEPMVEEKAAVPTMNDIQAYGFSRELLGRIGTLHTIPALTKSDYIQLFINGKTSAAGKYAALFSKLGVQFTIDENACEQLAKEAVERSMGARAVEAIIREQVLYAAQEIDKDPSIVKAILTVNNGKIEFRYTHGKRELPLLEENSIETVNLCSYLHSEKSISDIASQWSALSGRGNEELCYYFLQTTLRYFALEVEPEEQTLNSLNLFVKQTKRQGLEGELTTFDVLITNQIPKTGTSTAHSVMLYYYHLFQELDGENTYAVLKYMMKQIEEKSKIRWN